MNLRRLILGSTVAVAATLVGALPAHAQFGIGAGLNFSDFEDIDSSSGSATLDASNGYHFGLFVNLGSGALSLRPGVYYHRLGTYDFPSGDEPGGHRSPGRRSTDPARGPFAPSCLRVRS